LLKEKMFWIGILYFAEGFPLGVFYELFPVHFRQQGVALWQIGFMSLLGLSWTLKFLWAPAIDHYRHHRRWMFTVDVLMGAVLLVFAMKSGFGPWVWVAIGAFTLLSATNDIAIDGYTIELLEKGELGLANGLRIGFYRVGMLASGVVLILSDYITWPGAYLCAALILCVLGAACLSAPKEKALATKKSIALWQELKSITHHPPAFAAVLLFLLGVLWLINQATAWSKTTPVFWPVAWGSAALFFAISAAAKSGSKRGEENKTLAAVTEGPMFGTLMDMLRRPYFAPVIVFILTFKLADSSMGFMIKPFWVDAGFSAAEIGLVSVNIGLVLSIAGGIAGGWITDRASIFKALWLLGLFQAISNLGYAAAAMILPTDGAGAALPFAHKAMMYSASAVESFTGGLGTAAFLAFLMAIVNKRHSATEYALLSSVFALSRSVAGWAGGFGAETLGYAAYFLLTFFLAFPAYALLPWVKKMLRYAEDQKNWAQH
ncbi:MAG: MFS transporter, partial [Nitrospiria bacterium]